MKYIVECESCGKLVRSDTVDKNGYCPNCSKEEYEEKKRREKK